MAPWSPFRRLRGKSVSTIAFRGMQEIRLAGLELGGGWEQVRRRTRDWATEELGRLWRDEARLAFLSSEGLEALRHAARAGLVDSRRLVEAGDRVYRREISLFGSPVPRQGPWPWHRDWRYDHAWEPAPYRSYRHREPRETPYDVKFPWELSRLGFLPSLVQADVLDGSSERTAKAFEILRDWDANNPLACSVNWYPMEAAMRAIQLCFVADMARQGRLSAEDAALLLALLAEHGEFIMRTVEVTDDAGNHLTAELVALLGIGWTLRGQYRNADRWFRFADRRIRQEVLEQLLPDGVNFEKSTAYHRLVLDLFLLAAVVSDRAGRPWQAETHGRLAAAARYNAAFLRPDGTCPLVGDSDDAMVFEFESRSPRDHRPDVGLAGLFLEDPELLSHAGGFPVSGAWLFGTKAAEIWQSFRDGAANGETLHRFPQGGVGIAKRGGNYLLMDVGEVGQNGLGGHGHNDLLSFELWIEGKALVVDPGSYLYTGDPGMHRQLRSTRAHNSIEVDGREIAPITGHFRIASSAKPVDVRMELRRGYVAIIEAGHTGYERLEDSVTLRRRVIFDVDRGVFRCRDKVRARGHHRCRRFLHFEPGISVHLGERFAVLEAGGAEFEVHWSNGSRATLVEDVVSPGFGHLEPSWTLVLEDRFSSARSLVFEIGPRGYRHPDIEEQ